MPTYDYTCSNCGHALEARQKISADPLRTCPNCQKETLKRGIGGGSATLRFTGSGFYITDYKDKGPETNDRCPCGKKDKCE